MSTRSLYEGVVSVFLKPFSSCVLAKIKNKKWKNSAFNILTLANTFTMLHNIIKVKKKVHFSDFGRVSLVLSVQAGIILVQQKNFFVPWQDYTYSIADLTNNYL